MIQNYNNQDHRASGGVGGYEMNGEMKEWEVIFLVSTNIKSETKEDAIKKFMEYNKIDSALSIYCTAKLA